MDLESPCNLLQSYDFSKRISTKVVPCNIVVHVQLQSPKKKKKRYIPLAEKSVIAINIGSRIRKDNSHL